MIKLLIQRLHNSIKTKGIIKTILLLPNRIVKQKRILNLKRSLELSKLISNLKQLDTNDYKIIGGYPIDLNLVNKKQIKKLSALTFGIHDEIAFELELKKLGFVVHSFDPSPISIKLFKNNPMLSKHINFHPIGLWINDGIVKFFESDPKNILSDENKEYSIVNISDSNNFIEIECKKLITIVKELNLKGIDYIKLDIEGAVPKILNDFFDNHSSYLPEQISFELEFPENSKSKKFFEMVLETKALLNKMNNLYTTFYYPKQDMFSHIIIYGKLK